ncbi:MAG: (4Fe-4S)-binding protein [Candidatus Binataceae bacterium]
MALNITWDKDVCSHSGNCAKAAPNLFRKEDGKFMLDPGAVSDEAARKAVAACPSHALRIKE